jgi:hypothetical protein
MKINGYPFHPYRFYCDTSGTIKGGDISVGTILFNEKFRKGFLAQFYSAFPTLTSFEKKATTLNVEKLKEVIKFMDDKRIHMICLPLGANTMYKHRRYVDDEIRRMLRREPIIKDFHEKVLSVVYYYALRHRAYPNYSYEGQVCAETQIKIDKVLSRLASISHRDNYGFHLSINHRRNQHMLKFADFVASAGRRIDKSFLKQLKYFSLLECQLKEEDIRHVFGLNKIEYNLQNRFKKAL